MRTDNRYSASGWDGSPASDRAVGRVLVLPGGHYTVDQPLLFWACEVLAQAGWRVVTMRWQWDDQVDPRAFVQAGAEWLESAAEPASTTLVVAKSLSSYAADWASARNYPAVWLTPVLTDDFVAGALTRYSAPALLVGGTSDRLWAAERATATGQQVVEIAGADHSLQLADDWRASLGVLHQVLTAIEAFAWTISQENVAHRGVQQH